MACVHAIDGVRQQSGLDGAEMLTEFTSFTEVNHSMRA